MRSDPEKQPEQGLGKGMRASGQTDARREATEPVQITELEQPAVKQSLLDLLPRSAINLGEMRTGIHAKGTMKP